MHLSDLEHALYSEGFSTIAGVDEAGRGPLAGPVVAAACIIPKGLQIFGVDDSKKITPKRRASLFELLTSNPKIQYGIGVASHQEIDTLNILKATHKAMMRAIEALSFLPSYVLVDGRDQLQELSIPAQPVIKGDATCYSIAAASIIAKEVRDRLMLEAHAKWPQYGFDKHKGYGTKKHREAIDIYGPCPIHRRSFEPLKSFLR